MPARLWLVATLGLLSLATCGAQHEVSAEAGGGASGPVEPQSDDPRLELVSASYWFDSSCGGEYSNIEVRVVAIETAIESVELLEYQVSGHMAGEDVGLDRRFLEDDAFPVKPGDTLELDFSDSNDNWAGECADFDGPYEATFSARFSVDGDIVTIEANADISCGWSECG